MMLYSFKTRLASELYFFRDTAPGNIKMQGFTAVLIKKRLG